MKHIKYILMLILFILLINFSCSQLEKSNQNTLPEDQTNLELIKQLHQDSVSYVDRLIELSSDSIEFYAAGPQDQLPWAGIIHGPQNLRANFKIILDIMDYEIFDAKEFIAQGKQVVAVISAKATARTTGKTVESDIVRIYTLENGKIVKARTYYDTAAYVDAISLN